MSKLLSIVAAAIVLSVPHVSLAADPDRLVNPNQIEPDGTTPLHWAVQQDSLDRVQALLAGGANVNASDTRVDGAGTRSFNATDTIQYIPALEAIENVNVATSSFDADQSAGGGYINVTVKSGTNALHGSAFEDFSNQSLAAYQWAANRSLAKLPYSNNQFGGTIGGPIKKDKVFYFLSYEGNRLVQGNAVPAEVPTAAMKGGNLSGSPSPIYDPLTGAANGAGRMIRCRIR